MPSRPPFPIGKKKLTARFDYAARCRASRVGLLVWLIPATLEAIEHVEVHRPADRDRFPIGSARIEAIGLWQHRERGMRLVEGGPVALEERDATVDIEVLAHAVIFLDRLSRSFEQRDRSGALAQIGAQLALMPVKNTGVALRLVGLAPVAD